MVILLLCVAAVAWATVVAHIIHKNIAPKYIWLHIVTHGGFLQTYALTIHRVRRKGIPLEIHSFCIRARGIVINFNYCATHSIQFIQCSTVGGPSGTTWNDIPWQGKLADLVRLHVALVPLDLGTDPDLCFMKANPGECRLCPCARTRVFSPFICPVVWPLKQNRPRGLHPILHILARVRKLLRVIF